MINGTQHSTMWQLNIDSHNRHIRYCGGKTETITHLLSSASAKDLNHVQPQCHFCEHHIRLSWDDVARWICAVPVSMDNVFLRRTVGFCVASYGSQRRSGQRVSYDLWRCLSIWSSVTAQRSSRWGGLHSWLREVAEVESFIWPCRGQVDEVTKGLQGLPKCKGHTRQR